MRCQDYIEIDAKAGGVKEYCGGSLPSQPYIVGTGHFTLKLRSSFANTYSGFRLFVTCFNEERNDGSCTESAGVRELELDSHSNNVERMQKSGHGTIEVDDLSVPLENTGVSPVSLTSSDRKSIDSLMKSLYNVALSQTRRKITSWPPASYSRNEPGDILDLSELNEPVVSQEPSLSPILPQPQPEKLEYPEPIIELPIIRPIEASQRRKRSVIGKHEATVSLDSVATKEAVKNENACNPIVRSVTKSYLTIAQRLQPNEVQMARREYLHELAQQNLH